MRDFINDGWCCFDFLGIIDSATIYLYSANNILVYLYNRGVCANNNSFPKKQFVIPIEALTRWTITWRVSVFMVSV